MPHPKGPTPRLLCLLQCGRVKGLQGTTGGLKSIQQEERQWWGYHYCLLNELLLVQRTDASKKVQQVSKDA